MNAVLHGLLRVLPRPFRDEFAAELIDQLDRDYAHAKSRGRLAALAFAIGSAADLLRTGVAEHLNPSWTPPRDPVREGKTMFDEWTRDLRHAVRSLRRTPGFTAMTVGTLGLAIGVNAGMFSVVDTVLLNPLPYANASSLVYIAATAPGSDLPGEFGVSSEFYLQYKESKLIENVSTYNSFTSTLRDGDHVERIRMSQPTYSLFATLGVQPILGRLPALEDQGRAMVISSALWHSWFNGDSAVIGKSYFASGDMRTVVGVMPAGFDFPREGTMLWMPADIRAEGLVPGRFGTTLVARLKPGTTPEALANELTALSKRLPERFGGSAKYAKIIEQHRTVVRPLTDQLLDGVTRPLWVLLGAVAIVLLIACANVANLFMVRAEGRQRDLAVRRAIGAGRGQLVRLQLSESFVVALLAGALAVGLSAISLPAFVRVAPAGIPRLAQVSLSPITLLFTLGIAMISALACGAVPAMRASAPDMRRLREGGRGSTRKRHIARDTLVVAQTALALVLLIGSGLLVRSFWQLRNVNPGYSTKDIFTFQIAPENPQLRDGPSFARFQLNFLERMKTLPGVQSVGLVENVPLNEGTAGVRFRTESMGTEADAGSILQYTFTGGDYFKTMSIKVLAGRTFEDNDHLSALPNIVISNAAAKQMWPNENAIGKRLLMNGLTTWATVIGVVDDVMQNDFRTAGQPLVYLPLVGPTPQSWAVSSPAYVVKTARAEAIAPEIRELVRQMAPEAPMYRMFTMEGLAADSMVGLSFTMLTLGIASSLALLLGAVGLYGVLSYVVAERTREIGVRMALGAKAEQVRRMVVAQGARVVGIGVAIGVVVAIISTKALGSLLFGVAPLDIATFVGMSACMVTIGLLASYMPARRASNVDPIESLRGD